MEEGYAAAANAGVERLRLWRSDMRLRRAI